MKMKQEHFDKLKRLITKTNAYNNPVYYVSFERYRWDCLWAIPREERGEIARELYYYLNDNNIDTALRKITAEKFYENIRD